MVTSVWVDWFTAGDIQGAISYNALMNSMTQKLLTGCTALMIIAICFAFQFPSVDMTSPKAFYGYIVFTILITGYLFFLVTQKNHAALQEELQLPILLIILSLLSHGIWAVFSGHPVLFREFVRIAPGLVLVLIWWQQGVTLQVQRTLHMIIAVSMSIVALGGLAQALGLDPLAWHYSFAEGVFSTIGHPNMLAPCMVVGAACAWALGRSASGLLGRWIWWSILPIHLICLIFTVSKGAWAGALIAGIITLGIYGSTRLKRWALAVAVFICLAVAIIGLVKGPSLKRVISDNALRPSIWRSSMKMMNSPKRWLIGTGPGTWFIHFPETRGPEFLPTFRRTENIRHAHNEFIERLTDTGVIGLILYIGICFLVMSRFYKRHAIRSLSPGELASFYAIVALLIHSIVSVNFRVFSIWTLFWIVGGTGLITRTDGLQDTSHDTQMGSSERILSLVLGVIFLILCGVGVNTTYGSMGSADLQYQGQTRMGGPERSLAIALLTDAVKADPGNLDAEYDLAVTLYEAGEFQESERHFNRIGEIAPNFQRIHMNQAILYLQWGRKIGAAHMIETAYSEIQRELALNDMDENHYLLGAIENARGNTTESRAAFREFLSRMDQIRLEMETIRGFRQDDAVDLVKPKNWDMLLEMEKIAKDASGKHPSY